MLNNSRWFSFCCRLLSTKVSLEELRVVATIRGGI